MSDVDDGPHVDDQHSRVKSARAAISNLRVGGMTDEETDIARDALGSLLALDEAMAERSAFDVADRHDGGDA